MLIARSIPFYRKDRDPYPPDAVILGNGTDDIVETTIHRLQTLETVIIRRVHAVSLDELLKRPDFENLVIDPRDIKYSIHNFFLKLRERGTEKQFKYYFAQLLKRHPVIAYIYHMDLSGHSTAFFYLMSELKERFGYTFNTPFCDLGCGPGHMLWHLLDKEGMIPFGRIAMVDNDHASMEYARELMSWKSVGVQSGLHDFHFLEGDAREVHEMAEAEGIQFQTVYSSLVLQWVKDPDRVIKSIYDSMAPGGIFILIVEDPPNITAATPIAVLKARAEKKKRHTTIGFDEGIQYEKILRKCEESGFVIENYLKRTMGMSSDEEIDRLIPRYKKLGKKGFDNLTPDEKKEFVQIYGIFKNYHTAIAFVLRKPQN